VRHVALALVLHNHQPVGNFGWVFADVYEQAYRPMLDALERHLDRVNPSTPAKKRTKNRRKPKPQ
jgi:hypothetical protein